jgi:hypothetical protein
MPEVNSSVQVTGDGFFTVDGQKLDLGTLMMQLQMERTKMIDTGIKDQMSEIKDRNTKLKAFNELLGMMRKFKANKCATNDDNAAGQRFNLPGMEGNKNVTEWFREFGMSGSYTDVNPGDGTKEWEAEWDANIEVMKGQIDSLNSDSQLSMIRLQSLIDKRNQSFDMMTNTLSKDSKTRDSIIGNMR